MTTSILDNVLNATASNGGPSVIREEHNTNNINTHAKDDTWDMNTVTRTRIESGWDAGEWGVSYENALKLSETPEGREELRMRALRRANLFIGTNDKVAMFSAFETPWHGLGVTVNQAATSAEALHLASLDNWNLQKVQAFIDFGDVTGLAKELQPREENFTEGNDPNRIPIDRYAIVRPSDGAVLGCVGGRYQIVSNEEIFAFADAVINEGAKFHTAGAIGNGSTVWMLAEMPSSSSLVAEGDEITHYAMFTTTHDGSGSIRCYPTTVRTVCQNTYRQSFADRKRGIAMRHSKNVKSHIKEAQKALGLQGSTSIRGNRSPTSCYSSRVSHGLFQPVYRRHR